MTTIADAVRQSLMRPDTPQDAVRASLQTAPPSGDLDAELQRIARETGVPLTSARNNPDVVRGQYQNDQVIRALGGRPVATQFLADPDRAAIARDDVKSLTDLEDLITGEMKSDEQSFLPGLLDAGRRGLAEGRQNLSLLFRDLGLFASLERAQTAAGGAGATNTAAFLAEQERLSQRFPPSAASAAGMRAISEAPTMASAFAAALDNPGAVLETTVQSFGASLPSVAAGALGGATLGPLGAVAGVFGGSFSVEYGATLQDTLAEAEVDLRKITELQNALANPEIMGKAREKAVLRGVPIATFDAITAGLAGRLLAGASRSATSIGTRVAGEAGLQMGGGAAGEGTAQLLTGEYRPGDILLEALAELPTSIVEVPSNWRDASQRAERAAKRREQMEKLKGLSEAAKVRARDAETFEAFIADAIEQNPALDSLYIDAQTLMQSGLAEQAAALSPSIAEQLAAAAAVGGQVRVPLSEYAARLAGTPVDEVLLQNVRTEPDGMSAREAEEFMQGAQAELEREVARAVGDEAAVAPFRASVQAVATRVRDMLVAAGQRPQVAEAYAALTSNFYAAMAVRLGKTPEEVFDEFPQAVFGEGLDQGDVLGQTALDPATTPALDVDGVARSTTNSEGRPIHPTEEGVRNFWRWFGDSKVVDEQGRPLVVYHGTTGDIYQFDAAQRGTNTGAESARMGFFFVVDPVTAESYANFAATDARVQALLRAADEAEQRGDWDAYDELVQEYEALDLSFSDPQNRMAGQNVLPVFTSLANPLRVDAQGETATGFDISAAIKQAVQEGRDGVIIDNLDDAAGLANRPATHVIAFRPEQIKSAVGNSGEFDPKNPGILMQGEGARGSYNPSTNTIRLLKAADLSTYLHESGHFFLENLINIAEQIQARGGPATPGEQSIIDDARILFDWFGVQDMPTWFALSFEEKRSYHERFAESFEAYLFSGEAPSLELQPFFQKFRVWLTNVYRNLKAFIARNPEAGKLNDEVRGVMDRMLATNEQIDLARRARSMLPLFSSPEEGQMTPEEFAEIQKLGEQATNDALEELQTRGLRDMQWLRNARARALKRLQREAKETRAAVRASARTAVLSQPIYRAWAFLAGRLTPGDKAAMAGPARPKSKAGPVDPTVDSLFVAIAKLGGLNRAEVESEWDLDPATRIAMPLFGTPVLRRNGGRSIDGMAEALMQFGYLAQNAAGREELRSFEELFDKQLRGEPVYSRQVDAAVLLPDPEPGETVPPELLGAARLSVPAMQRMGIEQTVIDLLAARKLAAQDGVHPDLVAQMFEMETGDDLVALLAQATPPREAVEAETDARMIEEYADLSSPEAIERAADLAVHNDARARMVAAEANALQKMAEGGREAAGADRRGRPTTRALVPQAARQFAAALIARLKIRNVKPAQYTGTAARAGREAEKAFRAGDVERAAAEKRTQTVQTYAAREAYKALDEIDRGIQYLRKFARDSTRKGLARDYLAQIDAMLERFDLKQRSLKDIDRRTSLRDWLESQREQGFEPEIDPRIANEARAQNYRDLTVEEFRGLVDAVRQIEHLARLKQRLLTSRDQKAFEAVRDDITQSIEDNARRTITPRTATTWWERAMAGIRRFVASHYKAAALARNFDGGVDGGPFWEYFIRPANERGDQETQMRAEATERAMAILAPLFASGPMEGRRTMFPTIGRALHRSERIAVALNAGNQGNLQRLLGGEGWTRAQIQPVLESLTAAEWQAVQAVWDLFESYRPLIAAKETRVYGKEPNWVEATGFDIATSDGQTVTLRGGYYPIKYDPAASARAEEQADAEAARQQLRGAYTSATTRRSFTKARAEEVTGRPVLLTFDGLYQGLNEVIHDLVWHEWLIDVNRLLRSDNVQQAIRKHHGPEAAAQLKQWVTDIAGGERTAHNEEAASWIRRNVSVAGLGFNLISGAMQVTGYANSLVRVGVKWMGPALADYATRPVAMTREVQGLSPFMALRARTQFRELNELRNRVQGQSTLMRNLQAGAFLMIVRMQQIVDVPTWHAAYTRALAAGNDEARAIALADQTVIDTQGSGMLKDLSAMERGGAALKLFTVFYSYMNTVWNLAATNAALRESRLNKALNNLLIFVVPVVGAHLIREVLTPKAGDDDDDEAYWTELAKTLAADEISYLLGTMVFARELGNLGGVLIGADSGARGFSGTAGERLFSDLYGLGQQVSQGEFDAAMRKKLVNVLGSGAGLPAAQINRTWNGIEALMNDETNNPAAVLFGVAQ